jgi:hypothetical protein
MIDPLRSPPYDNFFTEQDTSALRRIAMVCRGVFLMLAACAVVPGGSAIGQEPQADQVTQHLFEQYVARQGKINTESVMAATHLVAERGRESGFWKKVVAELQRDNPSSEIGCVRVLGKMLAADAAAGDALRRQKETGEVNAGIPRVFLGPEVVAALVERGGKADRFRSDHYAIALARARAPEARGFFQSILRGRAEPTGAPGTAPASWRHLDSTRFHAAVGLAQLGDAEGIEWLIEHCAFSQGDVTNARPQGGPRGGDLGACCVEALCQLSGERQRTSQAEWAAWWKSADRKRLHDRAVSFSDP